jgi:hypothetical protein
MEEEGTSEKELAAVVGVMMNSAAEVDLRQANVEALSPPEVVTPESFSGTTADSGLASTSPRPSLSHSEILHRYTSFRSLPLTLQSLRDHSSTRELLGEFADLLRRAQWERLGARVANESGMEGMGQEGEEEEEEEEEGGEDDEEEHEEKDSDGEDAAPHPAASAQAQQPDVDMAESGVVTAPTADTILSSYTVVTRPQMSTRFRNLLLECVIHRSLEITRALRTTQRQVHNADLPSAARLSRGHTLAIASYVRGFLSQSIRLTEFESLVVCHLEREVKGIMQTAWVHGGITGSKRIGDLLFERQQYLLALRVYSFARIDGCALTTMCALPSHFERLVLHLQYLAEAFEFSYEDALKRIVQLNGGPATPSSLAASPGGLIPSHLSNPLKFASLLVGPGYARMEPERIVAILGLEQHLQPDDTLHTQIQHLRTTLAQPPGSANAGEQLIDPID